MDNGVDQDLEDNDSGVVETTLGGKEFRGSVEPSDPMAPELKPAPEGTPEQFWDPVKGELRTEALLKSYSELRKKMDGGSDDEPKADDEPKDDEPKGDEPKDDEPKADDEPKDDEPKDDPETPPALEDAITSAREAYAETGELSEEAREPLKKLGITDEQINFYIEGVKAKEAALQLTAVEIAGSAEDLNAALAWAASADSGWTDKQRIAFNSQMGDVDTIKLAMPGLMSAFRAANPGEGKLTTKTTGLSRGDVYEHMDDFSQDLAEADKLRDKVKRRKAIDKLRRSREAGTIKSEGRPSRR